MPSHWCYKPSKPLYFASSYDQKVYKKDTANYKLCIEVFIKSQKKDIGMHQQAIKVATDDWNNFIIGTQ